MSDRDWDNVSRHEADIRNGDAIVFIWSAGDVESLAEVYDVDVTEEQCREVLAQAKRYYDASVGLSFTELDYWFNEVVL